MITPRRRWIRFIRTGLHVMFSRPDRSVFLVLMLSTLGFPQPVIAQGRALLSPEIQKDLTWLPADTETVIAAQGFTLPEETREKKESKDVNAEFFARSALGVASAKDSVWWDQLAGSKIKLAIFGARSYDVVTSTLPTHRSESCSIISFDQPAPDARKAWEETTGKKAAELRSIDGHKIYMYPPSLKMSGWARRKAWQHDMFVWLDDATFIAASSDAYLEEVLSRVTRNPERVALAVGLPEWKHTDTTATVWMVRHIPRPRTPLSGMTFSMTGNKYIATYETSNGNAEGAMAVRKLWNDASLTDSLKVDLSNQNAIVARGEIGSRLESDWLAVFSFGMNLYWSECLDDLPGFPPERVSDDAK